MAKAEQGLYRFALGREATPHVTATGTGNVVLEFCKWNYATM